jgi:hypothetical protein
MGLKVEDYARTETRADAHEALDICCNPANLGGMKRKKVNQRKPHLELQIDLGDLDKSYGGADRRAYQSVSSLLYSSSLFQSSLLHHMFP